MADKHQEYRRHYRAQPVAELLTPLAEPSLRRRGFAQGRLMQEWTAIVGETLGRVSAPERIRFPRGEHTGGTLVIRTAHGWGTEFQHLAPDRRQLGAGLGAMRLGAGQRITDAGVVIVAGGVDMDMSWRHDPASIGGRTSITNPSIPPGIARSGRPALAYPALAHGRCPADRRGALWGRAQSSSPPSWPPADRTRHRG